MTPVRPTANVPQMEITLLHQTDSLLIDPDGHGPITQIILWADQYPPNRPYLANQAQVYRDLLHQRGPPHLINPRWRLPYDIREAPC